MLSIIKNRRILSLVGVGVIVFSFAFASVGPSNVAYADLKCPDGQTLNPAKDGCLDANGSPTADTPTEDGTGTPANGNQPNGNDADTTTCAVESIGWILCPIINSAAKISDKAFDVLANNFLATDAALINDKFNNGTETGTKQAWNIFKNLANIMFILAFLLVVVSQVTGYGISNYGLKKMIPRLIVAAIAVNVSFYICQIVVDLTNILGYEIQNLLANIANGLGPSVFGDASQFGASEQSSGASILTVIAGMALASAVVWYVLPFLGSVVLMVIVIVLVIIMILMLRKALIVLLIVISPVAFVLYLLPNTERYFTKWLNMFVQLLLVFPTVGLLFGAGQLASTVILVSGGQTKEEYDAALNCDAEDRSAVKEFAQNSAHGYNLCGGDSINITGTKDGGKSCPQSNLTQNGCMPKVTASWQLGLVATAVAVAPLFAVYSVLKGALNAAGAIGGKITALSGKLTNSSVKRAQQSNADRAKLIGQRYQKAAMQSSRLPGGRAFRRNVRRGLEKDEAESALNAAKAGIALSDPKNATIANQNIANQQAVSAANSQQMMNYARDRAQGVGPKPADSLGVEGMLAAEMALASQQSKATAEAIKDIEVNIDGSDVETLKQGLATAIKNKDSVAARAYQNSLFRSGSAGLEKYHEAIDGANAGNLAAVNDSLNANVRANWGKIKDSDPSIMNAATKGGTLKSHYESGSTWAGLSAAQFANLSSGAQKKAAGSISAQAMGDLLKENNAQLLAAVKPDARNELARRDSKFNN